MSRRKKKMYVKNLEEKTQLMARHLAILEMENSHLRALLNATQQAQIPNLTSLPSVAASHFHGAHGVGIGHGVNGFPQHFKLPHFQIPSLSTSTTNNSGVVSNTETSNNNSTANTDRNSVEIQDNDNDDMNGPSLKKRRLNNGSSSNTNTNTTVSSNSNTNTNNTMHGTPSPSCDNSSDVSILEPLPVPIPCHQGVNNQQKLSPPPPPPGPPSHSHSHPPPPSSMGVPISYSHLIPPNMAQLHAQRLMSYHQHQQHQHGAYAQRIPVPPHLLRGHGHNAAQMGINKSDILPKIDKIEAIVIDKDDSVQIDDDLQQNIDSKSMEIESHNINDDIPPPVVVPGSRLSDEFDINLLDDDDIIDETVDESGSVMQFQQEMKTNMVYL